jgi:hypothetical protein
MPFFGVAYPVISSVGSCCVSTAISSYAVLRWIPQNDTTQPKTKTSNIKHQYLFMITASLTTVLADWKAIGTYTVYNTYKKGKIRANIG